MKKLVLLTSALIILLALTQCKSQKKDLVGVWQLKDMVVNGTNLAGNSLGGWLWEFNTEGGFLIDVAGMREKGTYTLKDSLLTLRHGADKNMHNQVYKVSKLDATQLELISTETGYNTNMHFTKRKDTDATVDKD